MANSEYKSNRSVAKNPTVSISVDDPRLAWDQIGLTKATIGAEIEIIGLNGIPVLTGGTTVTNPGGPSYPIIPPDPTGPINEALPQGITGLVAEWSGDDIVLTFNFDTQDSANSGIYRFLVKLRDGTNNKEYLLRAGFGYESTFLSTSSSEQTLTILNSDIQQTGIPLSQNINQVGVASCNVYRCNDYVTATVPLYESSFPKPIFTLSHGVDYYIVSMDPANLALALEENFYGIIIEEKITTETNPANVSLTEGWRQATAITTNADSFIYTPDNAHRWVRVKYVAVSGNNSVYSDIADVTPDPFMPGNLDAPTNFVSASMAWQGNDVNITFVRPSTNAGTVIKVKIVPYLNDVESTILRGFYYKTLDALDTEFVISSVELYGQLGNYYSKIKAYVTALSAQGVESTTTLDIGPIVRANPLALVYPTLGTPNVNLPTGVFRVSPIANGYLVDYDMPSGATKLEVYESATAWTAVPTNDDNMVYSGLSPATIITADNSSRYIIVRYYDQYENTSYYSMQKAGQESGVQVTPLDIGLSSLIENPIKIITDGSIFAGIGDSTEYPQVFFNKDGLFAYDASGNWTTQIINSAASASPTFITKSAQIADWVITPTKIENTLNLISTTATGVLGQSTITVSSSTGIAIGQRVRGTGIGAGATVASISGTTITLSVPNFATVSGTVSFKATLYTGLSGTSTYAFWAGSDTAGNSDGLANFSVTQAGSVIARKISIIGDGTSSDLINSGGGTFKVTNSGALTATSATINGSISVEAQSYFNANVNILSGSYLIAGGTGTDKVKIGSQGLLAEDQLGVASTKIYSDPQVSTRTTSHNGIVIPKTTSGVTLWSQKAVFGTSLAHGWTIADNYIYSNYISLNGSDSNQSITIVTKDANSAKGVQISSGVATDIAIKVGNFTDPSFTVTHNGKVFAQEAEIVGTIKASLGGIGSFNASNQLTNGWEIDASGLTAVGLGARITLGDYSIRSTNNDGSDFTIFDNQLMTTIFKTDSVVGAGEDAKRIFLGSPTRHVEVSKSALLSGNGSTVALPSTNNTVLSAYRSGGLRNIFTVSNGQFSTDSSGNVLEYPSALKGDILVVYNPNLPTVNSNWNEIIGIYINTQGSQGVTYYYARYTENLSTGTCISEPQLVDTVTSLPSGFVADTLFTVNPLSESFTRGYYSTISAADAISKLAAEANYCGVTTTPVIATSSTISTGNTGASIIVTSTGFATTVSASDFIIATGTSGLTLSSITNTSTTSKTLVFNGTVTSGTLQITAKTSAFNPVASSNSNTLTLSSSGATTTTTTTPGTFGITGTPTSTSTTITYSWANPPAGTIYYTASYRPLGGSITSTTVSGTSHTFTGLEPNTSYELIVSAISGGGGTLASDSVSGIFTQSAATSVPSGGSITLTGSTSPGSVLTATTSGWSNSPTSYSLAIRIARNGDVPTESSEIVASSTTTSATYTIENTVGAKLRAFVTATNAIGTSTSAVSGVVTVTATGATTTTTATPTTSAPTTTTTTAAPTTWYCSISSNVTGNFQSTETSDQSGSVCDQYAIACSTSGYPAYPAIPACPTTAGPTTTTTASGPNPGDSCGTATAISNGPCNGFGSVRSAAGACYYDIFMSCVRAATFWDTDCMSYYDGALSC